MSSFFRSGETSSSDYTETESSDGEQQMDAKNTRNVRGLVESSDDDDSARVVKSQKDKIFDACQLLCNAVVKALKMEDIIKSHDAFKQLVQLVVKANAIFSKSGFPSCIIKTVQQILVLIRGLDIPQLDANNTKALKEFLMNVDKFKKAYPKQFDAGNKALAAANAAAAPKKSGLFAGSDEEEDEDEEDEEDDEDEEEDEDDEVLTSEDELSEEEVEEEEEEEIDLTKFQGKITRDFWVKKPSQLAKSAQSTADQAKAEAAEKEKAKLLKEQKRQAKAAESKQGLIGEDGQMLTKMEKRHMDALKARSNETITAEVMNKKLREIIGQRGKRSRAEIPTILTELFFLKDKSIDEPNRLRIQTLIALFHLDLHSKSTDSMPLTHWKESRHQIAEILSILKTNVKVVRLVEDDYSIDDSAFANVDFDPDVEMAMNDGATSQQDIDARKAWVNERKEALAKAKETAQQEQQQEQAQQSKQDLQYVEGNLHSYLYKLSTEFYIGLQQCDKLSSAEYVNRLRELPKLLTLLKDSYQYYIDINKSRLSKRVAELILSYIYYTYNAQLDSLLHPEQQKQQTEVDQWAEIVLASDEPRSRIKALLYQLYHAALHNKYEFAKERIAMSYVVDSINELDIHTRILYNRTITQIGLSAFRYGDYKGTLTYLGDLYNQGPRIAELLAQGTATRAFDAITASGKEDPEYTEAKKRIYPYHQHISHDYLDAAHLISAMIVEIPLIAEHGLSINSRRVVSKTFRRHYSLFLGRYNAQNITPSIDSARDAIMVAAQAISKGQWSKTIDLLTREIPSLWTANQEQTPLVKAALINAVKVASLKSYMLTNCTVYTSVSLSTFVTMFQLPTKTVQQIINTQAYNDVIHAAWDANGVEQAPKEDPVLILARNNLVSQRAGMSFLEKLQSVNTALEKVQTTTTAVPQRR